MNPAGICWMDNGRMVLLLLCIGCLFCFDLVSSSSQPGTRVVDGRDLAPRKPNILLLLVDDLGWNNVGKEVFF